MLNNVPVTTLQCQMLPAHMDSLFACHTSKNKESVVSHALSIRHHTAFITGDHSGSQHCIISTKPLRRKCGRSMDVTKKNSPNTPPWTG